MVLNAVELKNLTFSYDEEEKILNNVNLNIENGKFYTILGPNGSGKTTLMRIISKSLNTSQNTVFIDNKDIYSLKNKVLAKKVSTVPQNTVVEFDFSAHDIVLMGRAPHISRFSSENEEDLKIVQSAMEMTNTWHLRHKSINALSGGERQMVVVARAIAQESEIVLMDEPISHLDIHHQIELLNQIKSLNENKHKTIIAVLHDLNIAASYSDYMILMYKGRIHTFGPPEEVLKADKIKEVYGVNVHIIENPLTGKPFIIPVI